MQQAKQPIKGIRTPERWIVKEILKKPKISEKIIFARINPAEFRSLSARLVKVELCSKGIHER
jgi:hypothetical protein